MASSDYDYIIYYFSGLFGLARRHPGSSRLSESVSNQGNRKILLNFRMVYPVNFFRGTRPLWQFWKRKNTRDSHHNIFKLENTVTIFQDHFCGIVIVAACTYFEGKSRVRKSFLACELSCSRPEIERPETSIQSLFFLSITWFTKINDEDRPPTLRCTFH